MVTQLNGESERNWFYGN